MQTKTSLCSAKKSGKERTGAENLRAAREWLKKEAAAGRIILAKSRKIYVPPPPPKDRVDFWQAYNETRAERFF